jgi:hypothetical protein
MGIKYAPKFTQIGHFGFKIYPLATLLYTPMVTYFSALMVVTSRSPCSLRAIFTRHLSLFPEFRYVEHQNVGSLSFDIKMP